MIKLIAILASGVIVGYLLRDNHLVKRFSGALMPTIILLLFVMGVEIGGNDEVVRNLHILGGEALLIALAAVAGSLLLAKVVYCLFFARRGVSDER